MELEIKNFAKMTIQDLKDNREAIINFANEKGLELKPFMEDLAWLVNTGGVRETDVMEWVYNHWYYTRASRSRKTSKVAESRARAVQEGRIDEFNMNSYLSSKNNY